jgi:hypothetical protein
VKFDSRQRQLSEAVYQFVFQMLDAEPELSGNDAGKVAAHLQREFERKYQAMMGMGR